jgi:hypothetical protein
MSSLSALNSLPVSPRINQLDAAMLDNEVIQNLSEQLKNALVYIPSPHFNFSTKTVAAAADFLFCLVTTGRQLPTPGQAMLCEARRMQIASTSLNTLCMNIRICSVSEAAKRAKSFLPSPHPRIFRRTELVSASTLLDPILLAATGHRCRHSPPDAATSCE